MHQPDARRPLEHPGGPVGLGRLGRRGLVRPDEEFHRAGEEEGVEHSAGGVPHPLDLGLAGVVLVGWAHGGLDEPPGGIAGEPDSQEEDEHPTERLADDRLQGPLLVGLGLGLAAPGGHLYGQDAHHHVDKAAGHQAGTGQSRQPRALRRILEGVLGPVLHLLHVHAGSHPQPVSDAAHRQTAVVD